LCSLTRAALLIVTGHPFRLPIRQQQSTVYVRRP
jgi:hypothetical protein